MLRLNYFFMKAFSFLAIIAAASFAASAQETPRWLRQNAISPDGSKVAFAYKGDIFTVGINGGQALQITSNEAYDSNPMWMPDGRSIVFNSDREGGNDIFITPAEGGIPKRLTDYPGKVGLMCVLSDGRILFRAAIGQDVKFGGFPGEAQLWQVDTNARRPELVTSLPISKMSVSSDGNVIYEDYKGYEDTFRKHHTSSVTRDIWLYQGSQKDSKRFSINGDGKFTKLSSFNGEDREPVFAADGKTYYFLSEADGTLNVYKASIDAPGRQTQLTKFTKNPVRYLSVAKNGTLCFSWNGDLYTMREGGSPKKIEIKVNRDQTENDIEYITFRSGMTDGDVSPNGKEFAMVIHGEVFVTSVDYNTTKRITNTPEKEMYVSFSKDGRELYYSSERNGHWGIYKASLADKKEKYFTYATNIKEELVTPEDETCYQPVVSPDGKYLAYLRNRTELMIMETKGGKPKSLLKDANYSYSDGDVSFAWCPDSHYILSQYQANGGWNNTDVALIDIETGEVTDLTESGYSDGNFKWALGGKAMTWESDKYGYRSHGSWGSESDIFIMFLDSKEYSKFTKDEEDEEIEKMIEDEGKEKTEKQEKKEEAKEKKDSVKQAEKPKKLKLELDNREYRTIRLTRFAGNLGDYFLTNDAKKLYYITRLESGFDLCMMDIKKRSVTVLRKGINGILIPSKDGKYIFISDGNRITRMSTDNNSTKDISFSGDFEYKPKAERDYLFSHVWKQVEEKLYDPKMNGADWAACRENYSQFLPYINNNYDFANLLSEMLGELNSSHTGARAYMRSTKNIGHLGVLYDYEYDGDGLKIAEVLPNGVLNLADPEIKAGDIILAINGQEIKAGESWFKLLQNTVGKKTALKIKKGGKEISLFVEPSGSDSRQMYNRWVRQREDIVKKVSGGKIGYSHVEGMDSPSFRTTYSKILGKYRTTDAVVIDIRHNGGGWLHDDLATFLGGKEYMRFMPRGRYIGSEPFTRWTKPSCVLMCEDCYSDASMFPYTYRAMGIGKLVGMPVPGTGTAVWWETMMNGVVFGIPEVWTWGVKEGEYLENTQINPDISADNDPASLLRGEDPQLEAAVKSLMK
jgi:tricorn protease